MVGNKERVQRLALEAELTAKEKAEKKAAKKKTAKKTTAKKTTKKVAKKAAKKTAKKVAKKAAKKTTAKSGTPLIAGGSGSGLKMVWKILDPKSKTVATFPFIEQEAAHAKAAALTERTGEEHRVRSTKVPRDS